MNAPKPGIYEGVTFGDYAAWPCVNNSLLRLFTTKSPAHAKWYFDNGREETPALAFGKAADCYILEPQRFEVQYAIAPDCDKRTSAGKAQWAEFQAGLNGREFVTESDYVKIQSIYMKVVDSQAMRLIEGGKAQVCAVWIDKPTQLLCKARWDYWRDDIPMITDLKTTQSCEPDDFAKSIFTFGYYQQAGFYSMGMEALTSCEQPCFAILAVEKEEPFVHMAFDLGGKTLEAGRHDARKALDMYLECQKTGRWPGYSDKIVTLDMPLWCLEQCGVSRLNL
jgi:hypothetical protein